MSVLLLDKYDFNYSPVISNKKNSILSSFMKSQEEQERFAVESDCFPYTQGKSGYCWLVSALQCISIYLKRTQNISVMFDCNYLIFLDKLEKANAFFDGIIENIDKPIDDNTNSFILDQPMTDKGQWTMAVRLIKKYGLLPHESGQNCLISETKELNTILSYLLRMYAYDIRQLRERGGSISQIENLKQKSMQKVYNLLVDCLGKSYANIDIRRNYFSESVSFPIDEYVSIFAADAEETYIQYEVDYYQIYFLSVPDSIFDDLVNKQIVKDGFCWITGDAGKFYIKSKHILDDQIIDMSTLRSEEICMDRSHILKYHIGQMSHAMVLTDMKEVSNEKYYIAYDSGYEIESGMECKISRSWFKKFLFQAVVHKSLLPAEVMSKITNKQVKPWEFWGL